MSEKNIRKNLLIFLGFLFSGILIFGFFGKAVAKNCYDMYGSMEVHTSFANYFATGEGSFGGGWSNYPGVLVTVNADSPGVKWGDGGYSCQTFSIGTGCTGSNCRCNFSGSISAFTGGDGWIRWQYPNGAFASCDCSFYIDLPLNTSNAVYGGSWSRWLGGGTDVPGCNQDGVWPYNNNCYQLLSWSPSYWRYQTSNWGNGNTYIAYFDWCENECPYQGAKEQKTENGVTYERVCGYYDKDTCYDWSPWKAISQSPACLPLCGCRNVNYSGPISASHFNRLREDINNTEKTIKEKIDGSYKLTTWTDDPLKAGYKIRAVHINEMCDAVKRIEKKLKTGTTITCQSVKAGDLIKNSHIKNICNDLNNITDKWNASHGCK
jgi:hypothetical protein